MLSLERRGVAARVDRAQGWIFGGHRVHRSGPVRADLTVVIDEEIDDWLIRGDFRIVAYQGDVPIAERARVLRAWRRWTPPTPPAI